MPDPTISSLLAARLTEIISTPTDRVSCEHLTSTWCRLWSDFAAFRDIRDSLFDVRGHSVSAPRTDVAAALEAHLETAGLLKVVDGKLMARSPYAERLLRGTWLELLGASVAKAAGADEIHVGQQIGWKSHYDSKQYFNEIDVLARYGSNLCFVSCKAIAPLATESSLGIARVFDSIKEVAYWRDHFGAGSSRAILLTTADFFEEASHRIRNSALLEHADILRVSIVSADFGDYAGLVKGFRRVLGTSA